jgi:hypothetical protein
MVEGVGIAQGELVVTSTILAPTKSAVLSGAHGSTFRDPLGF